MIFHASVPITELAGLMAASDLGLQILDNIPAFYDGTSPNKFFDYLSVSLPVLINYPGWLADLVHRNSCGYAVPPSDPEAFAVALIHAAEHRDDLSVMGKRAQTLARNQFARADLADRFVDWLEAATAR